MPLPPPLHLLSTISDPDLAQRIADGLQQGDVQLDVQTATTWASYEEALQAAPDLVVAEHEAPAWHYDEALRLARERSGEVPFLLVNGTLPDEEVRKLLDEGVYACIDAQQLGDLSHLARAIERECRLRRRAEAAEEAQRAAEHRERAVLAALSEHVAVLDEHGEIIAVNDAWRTFARTNGDAELTRTDVGHNYLDVCEQAARRGDAEAGEVLRGLRRVLYGEAASFEHRYPCHGPQRRRWFEMRAVPLGSGRPGGIVIHRNDTERRQALARSRRSESLTRSLVQNAPAGFLVLDVLRDDGGRIEFACDRVNAAAASLLELERPTCIGQLLSRLVEDEPGPALLRQCVEAAASGEVVDREITYPRSGEKQHVQVTAVPLGDALLVTLRDMREARSHAEALREATERFNRLGDNVPGLVFQLEVPAAPQSTEPPSFTYVSAGCRTLFGIEPEAALADASTILDLIHPDDQHTFRQTARHAGQALRQWEMTVRAVIEGRTRWLQVVASPRPQAGDRLAWDGLLMDVTERTEAQRHERRLAAVVESSNDAIISCHADGTVVSWNRAAERLYGYAADEIIGQSVNRIVPEDRRQELEHLLSPTEHQVTQQFDSVGRRKDGSTIDISINVSVVEGSRSDDRGISLIVRDITMRKRFVREVIAAKKKANEMNRLKSAFMANMSHEIRTPLTGIIGYADLLADELDGEHQEFTHFIRDNSERLLHTLTSVLELAEIDSGSYTCQPTTVSLQDVVKQQVAALSERAARQGVRLKREGTAQDVYVAADEGALERVLQHVIGNAIKFAAGGQVQVSTTLDAGYGIVHVEDDGIGMSRAFLPRAFGEFEQESMGDDRDFEGSGLGLTLAQRLTQLMDGTIQIDSAPGEGTHVTVRLPLTQPPALPPPAASPSEADQPPADAPSTPEADADQPAREQAPAPRPGEAPAHLLVVDDDRSARGVLRLMLRHAYAVTAVSSRTEALAALDQHDFDLLLLDINLGEQHTGVELMRELRERPAYRHVPMVACTAYALPGDEARFLKAGFQAYVGKPVKKTTLLQTVADALEADVEAPGPQAAPEEVAVELPPLPATLPVVVELLAQARRNPDVDRLRATLEADPVTASWVLRRVNSAYYGLRQDVGSVDRAVTLLGLEPVCDLVLTEVLSRSFSDVESEPAHAVYEHLMRTSTGAAFLARALADCTGAAEPGAAFSAGMMHLIGRLALLSSDPVGYAQLWGNDGAPSPPSVQVELQHFGTDHIDVGRDVMRQWELPRELSAPVTYLERPSEAHGEPGRSLVLLVAPAHHVATRLASSADASEAVSTANVQEPLRMLAQVSNGSYERTCQCLEEAAEEARAFMDVAFRQGG